jgi:hypothetical protein
MSKEAVIDGFLTRNEGVVWRDIAGEVVIAERDSGKIRVLNKVGSLIWSLADGTRCFNDVVVEMCRRFEVTPEVAAGDAEEFLRLLLENDLVSLKNVAEKGWVAK